MFLRTLLLVAALIVGSLAEIDIDSVFRDTKAIPDMINEAPKEKLKIEFKNGLIVGDGIEYKPADTQTTPTIDWPSADPQKLYTIYMGCPDAPVEKSPIWREALHWLVLNVPGNEVNSGELYGSYMGPLSPKNAGIFRYVYLVYEQPDKIAYDGEYIGDNEFNARKCFKIKQFAEKYNLGQPVAGNIYRAQWDESVELQHNRLGITVVNE